MKLDQKDIYNLGLLIIAFISIVFVFRLFKKKQSNTLKVKLVQSKTISHDTFIYTFLLPNHKKSLGLKIGEHIQLKANIDNEIIRRKYTPISRVKHTGSFQLLIKVYRPCQKFKQGGKMTQYLENLPINSFVDIELPFGKINYLGNKVFLIPNNNQKQKRSFQNIYLVGGGTGITPLYQIIQYVSQEEHIDFAPNITLLFANKSQSDILLQNQLKQYQRINPKFKCYFSIDNPDSKWTGFRGYIDTDKIRATIPKDIKNTIFLSCGPPIMCNLVQKLLIAEKIPLNQILRF